ncbi:MAG TPA: hypothetical protein VM164_12120 [Burkholderiales bacterium]|nr:hypothetical protein [Burkholderiales bacterium]
MKTILRTGVLVMCIAFSACAEMRWTKPGADVNQASRDLDACRGAALQRSGPRGVGAAAGAEMQGTIERGTIAPSTRAAGTSDDRFIADHEEVRTCMLQRGYQLRPAA